MSNRYYSMRIDNVGWALFDRCVDDGEDSKRIGMAHNVTIATEICAALNSADGLAKAAVDKVDWAGHRGGVHVHGVGIDAGAPSAFSFDVETHAKRYFIGPGSDNALYGSATAIDSLRAKLNGRYHRIQELTKVNADLRVRLQGERDSYQRTHSDMRDVQKDLCAARDTRKVLDERINNLSQQLDEIRRATIVGRHTSESIVDYIARLERNQVTPGTVNTSNHWKDQFDIMSGRYEHLRKRISEL